MIIWHVGTRFRAHQKDVLDDARTIGAPIKSVKKITINNRYELAEFLDGICNAPPSTREATPALQGVMAQPELEWVPEFVRNDWERRRKVA